MIIFDVVDERPGCNVNLSWPLGWCVRRAGAPPGCACSLMSDASTASSPVCHATCAL
jgi:hypothetical protein